MDEDARYAIERAKWDAHAHHTAEAQALGPDDLVPDGTTFASHAAGHLSLTGMSEFVGDLQGKRVLEYGCGLGRLTVVLARSGAKVTAFDLSAASIEATRERLEYNGLADRVELVVASGEHLPFPDASFDVVIGKAVLHHLDPVAGSRELARVLVPGGRATFSEPLGTNPLVVFAREHLPYPGKHERGADVPLTREDIRTWMAPFAAGKLRPIQLTAMIERAFGFDTAFPVLRRLDDVILRAVPGTWRLCRYGILYLTTSTTTGEAASQQA
jgi:SAM-dependent methyltransferase